MLTSMGLSVKPSSISLSCCHPPSDPPSLFICLTPPPLPCPSPIILLLSLSPPLLFRFYLFTYFHCSASESSPLRRGTPNKSPVIYKPLSPVSSIHPPFPNSLFSFRRHCSTCLPVFRLTLLSFIY